MIESLHISLSPTALKACNRFVPYIEEYFDNYDYAKPKVDKARTKMNRPDNITGHQQRCFMTYWAAWAGDRGGIALDIGGAGVRHPYTLNSDIYRGKQYVYGGEVWPDIQCSGEDVSLFGDECFEAIISNHLIEHLAVPAYDVLKGWLRIIRNGGVIASIVPDAQFNDIFAIDPDHKQAWGAPAFLREVLEPLAAEKLIAIKEFDSLDNAFSFNFVIEKL